MCRDHGKLGFLCVMVLILSLVSLTVSSSYAALLLDGVLKVDGIKVENGKKVQLTLRLFDDEYAGKLLYEETQKVAVKQGKISFRFAQGKIIVPKKEPLPPASQLWVEVESADQVMTPRLNLAEVDQATELTNNSNTQSLERAALRTAGSSGLILGDNESEMKLDSSKHYTFSCKNTYNDAIYAESKNTAIEALGSTGINGTGDDSDYSVGGDFTSHGSEGFGVISSARTTNHDKVNYGGVFYADGITVEPNHSTGIAGFADNEGDYLTYGGFFETKSRQGIGAFGHAKGEVGIGVWGTADGTGGRGVTGWASAAGDSVANKGGFFKADGGAGIGVYGEATKAGAPLTNYGGFFKSAGGAGIGVYGEAINTGGMVTNYGGRFKSAGGTGYGVYAETTGSGSSNYGVYGKAGAGTGVYGKATDSIFGVGVKGVGGKYGVVGSGESVDFYASGNHSASNFAPFTGAHDVRFSEDMPEVIEPGMVVVLTGRVESCLRESGELNFSSTLPTVTLATKANDKAVFGVVVAQRELPEDHWYKAADSERFGIVNALGEGRVWVSNINGDIETGDYITSSTLAGYGQLQDDDFLHTYTIGKATETVDWQNVHEFITTKDGREIKVYPIAVVYTSG